MGSMADSLSAAGGEAMGEGAPLAVVVAVEGEQSVPAANPGMPEVPSLPEGTVPEAPGSPKRETGEIEEPPTKRARELSPELESKFIHLMEQTRKGFEVTGEALLLYSFSVVCRGHFMRYYDHYILAQGGINDITAFTVAFGFIFLVPESLF